MLVQVSPALCVAVKGDPKECGLDCDCLTEDRVEESEAGADLEEQVAKIETKCKRWKNLKFGLKQCERVGLLVTNG